MAWRVGEVAVLQSTVYFLLDYLDCLISLLEGISHSQGCTKTRTFQIESKIEVEREET